MAKHKSLSFLYDREDVDVADNENASIKKNDQIEQAEQKTANTQKNKSINSEEKKFLPENHSTEDIVNETPSVTEKIIKENETTTEETQNKEAKVTSFLKKKVSNTGNDKVKIGLYLPMEYHRMNELATKTYDFASKSDFVTKLFVSIIDHEEIPDLRELYLLASEKTSSAKVTKTGNSKSKYKYLERFLPNEKKKMKGECYMIYERHLSLLDEFAEEYHTTVSKIVCNMYNIMVS